MPPRPETAALFPSTYELRDGTYVGLAPRTQQDDDIAAVVFPDFSMRGRDIVASGHPGGARAGTAEAPQCEVA